MKSELLNYFKSKIVQSQKAIIIPHHNPDGDALGSALGLRSVLRSMGNDAVVIVPNGFPSFLNWMDGSNEIVNYDTESLAVEKLLAVSDLIIMVDFNSISRIKGLGKTIESSKIFKIIIDHHPDPDLNAADLVISDIDSSSTCELMYKVLKSSDFVKYISKESASCFYTGIMTDTGMLNHNSNRPGTYHIVADLIEKGIDKDEIHKLVFHSNSYSRMKLLGYCLLERMVIIEQFGAAYISLTKSELEKFNFQPGDTEGFVNYPLGIDGINVSALFMEQDNKIKISLRSRGEVAVNKLSEEYFKGGGHHNAAGGESLNNMNQTIETFVKALPKFV